MKTIAIITAAAISLSACAQEPGSTYDQHSGIAMAFSSPKMQSDGFNGANSMAVKGMTSTTKGQGIFISTMQQSWAFYDKFCSSGRCTDIPDSDRTVLGGGVIKEEFTIPFSDATWKQALQTGISGRIYGKKNMDIIMPANMFQEAEAEYQKMTGGVK